MKIFVVLILALFTYPTPRAVAKFCGNEVVHFKKSWDMEKKILSEGCTEIKVVYLKDGYLLMYGVKEIIGE